MQAGTADSAAGVEVVLFSGIWKVTVKSFFVFFSEETVKPLLLPNLVRFWTAISLSTSPSFFALTKQDQLPEIILCYNSGASLTCEDSDSLEDLKSLEAEGVKILTCGTCLDFYGLKEKLAVGGVTNMYEIVEIMESAGTIVRP